MLGMMAVAAAILVLLLHDEVFQIPGSQQRSPANWATSKNLRLVAATRTCNPDGLVGVKQV